MSVQSERTERTFFSPAHAISVKVPKSALRGSLDTGLLKKDIFAQNLPIRINKRVIVEASEAGTNDSIFFAPEAPTVDISKSRVTPTQYIKARPCDHDDIVYSDEDFEISFVGMSITPHDRFGGNDILLCSLAKTDEPEANMSQDRPVEALGNAQTISNVSVVSEESSATMSVAEKQKLDKEMKLQKSLDNLPLSLQLGRRDIPFIHYDPVIDGHDIGKKPDTFVPIPGTKRLYKQRRHDGSKQRNNTEFVRFTVMEIDSLSDEQLQAVRDIEEITVSVSKAAATIPYLKVVSWMLKVANSLGKAALKKVASPDHVMSEDVKFQIARRNMPLQSQEYGNYLRVSAALFFRRFHLYYPDF